MKTILFFASALLLQHASAADFFHVKRGGLYVIQNIDRGGQESKLIDNNVSAYDAESGMVVYSKAGSLYIVKNIANPKPEKLESNVGDFAFGGGVIAYVKGISLYVRRSTEPINQPSRQVVNASNVNWFSVKGGNIVYVTNGTTLNRVTSIDEGSSERVTYPIGDTMLLTE